MLSIALITFALVINYTIYRSPQRAFVCLILLLSSTIHWSLFDDKESFMYYGTAALSYVVSFAILNSIKKSLFTVHLQILCVLGIGINFLGFGMFEAYMSPFTYNFLMVCLFIAEFIRLMTRTKADKRYELLSRCDPVRTNAHLNRDSGL